MSDNVTKINDLRARVLAGETVSREELSQAIAAIRLDREASSAKSVAKAEAKAPTAAQLKIQNMENLDDLFA